MLLKINNTTHVNPRMVTHVSRGTVGAYTNRWAVWVYMVGQETPVYVETEDEQASLQLVEHISETA